MTDALLIPCPHCNSLNRVPAERLPEMPRCGRCQEALLLDQPLEVNATNFASQIKGDLPLLVDVWAAWCAPCRAFAPTFAQAAAQLSGRYRLAKLDSQANPELAAQLRIQGIPCLILLHQGQEIARRSGALPLGLLLDWLGQQGV